MSWQLLALVGGLLAQSLVLGGDAPSVPALAAVTTLLEDAPVAP